MKYLLLLISFSFSSLSQEASFEPLPNNELLTNYQLRGNIEDWMGKYSSVLSNSMFNENGIVYFDLRTRLSSQINIEKITRYKFSCASQIMIPIKTQYALFSAGKKLESPSEEIVMLAETVLEDNHTNLKQALIGTCSLWNSNDQIQNNEKLYVMLNALHNLVLEETTKDEKIILSLIFTVGIDSLIDVENQKSAPNQLFNVITLEQCGSDPECWSKNEQLVFTTAQGECLYQDNFEPEFKSKACSGL